MIETKCLASNSDGVVIVDSISPGIVEITSGLEQMEHRRNPNYGKDALIDYSVEQLGSNYSSNCFSPSPTEESCVLLLVSRVLSIIR
ncbi:MAG TPA: hypothetical protein VFJ05_01605 [Nitrososphaeraceae archaeon]|nr:hypothetical protein [Nitrososphaeraceae archaeon]